MGGEVAEEKTGGGARAERDERIPWETWLRGEPELTVVQGYDTVDRDLERLGITVSRIPLEAGATWRLQLPRGEQVEGWEPGNNGLSPPGEIAKLLEDVLAEKALIPMPPPSRDPGTLRLGEMLERQRRALLAHDPGTRLGTDPENLHQHRVAARRARAFLRAARAYVDPTWRRLLADPLRELGEATGPVRDLDVLLEHVRAELSALADEDRFGVEVLLEHFESERTASRRVLFDALDEDAYRAVLTRLRLPPRLATGVETVPLRRIARKELVRLLAAVDRIGKQPDDAALHQLRIGLKRVRYAAELSAPAGKRGRRFLAAARELQDLLGEHQDAVVAERRLRESTATDARTAAAFVAGRIAERQQVRRERVKAELPAAWKRLRRAGARLR
jgi:CHAD domain-containing protein